MILSYPVQRHKLPASQWRASPSVGFGFIEQSLGGDEETGSADAALEGGAFEEALLKRMQALGRREAFDGFELGAFNFGSHHEARIDEAAVEDDVARAAIAVVAAFLRAGEVQRIAQNFE